MGTRNVYLKATLAVYTLLVWAGAAGGTTAGEGGLSPAAVETLLRGIVSRTAAVQSISGMAVLEYTTSPRYNAQAFKDAQETATRAGKDGKLVLEPARVHAALADFDFLPEQGRWRYESVDLTNSGHSFSECGPAAADRRRDLPPSIFYLASVSDGKKVYQYDRALRTGSVDAYARDEQAPRGLSVLVDEALYGTARKLVERILQKQDGYSVLSAVPEVLDGHSCVRLAVRRDISAERKLLMRVWVSPELDYATVRAELIYYVAAKSPGKAPVLDDARVFEAADFRRPSDLLWCPYELRRHYFDYTKGTGEQAWDISERSRLVWLKMNDPSVEVVAPYQFPFDTDVTDNTMQTGTASVVPARATADVMPPDSFLTGLTSEKVAALLDASQR